MGSLPAAQGAKPGALSFVRARPGAAASFHGTDKAGFD